MNSNITLVKLDTVHLYVDTNKKILYFDVLNTTYSKENCITVLQYFKNFWILAQEQNVKYYLVIKINSIGVYPLTFYNNLIDCLSGLDDIFSKHLHSCSFLCNNTNPLLMLKPLFTMYNFVRPFSVSNNYEDMIAYFNRPENKL
jgi:hypothetical protein